MRSHGTTVTFVKRSDGALIGFSSEGHSGYAEAGKDIVCAAISALTQTALAGLKDVAGIPVMFDVDDNRAFIEVLTTPEATDEHIRQAQLLLKTLNEGLQAIQREYPRNLRIIFKERR